MTSHRLSASELRVLGSLMEKERTTPDQYPLSLNALRLACNQQTSREPVMTLSEDEVRDAVRSLANAGWARLASGTGSRVAKYRHDFDDSLDLYRRFATGRVIDRVGLGGGVIYAQIGLAWDRWDLRTGRHLGIVLPDTPWLVQLLS